MQYNKYCSNLTLSPSLSFDFFFNDTPAVTKQKLARQFDWNWNSIFKLYSKYHLPSPPLSLRLLGFPYSCISHGHVL